MITCSKKTLDNGLRLVAVEMPHLHSAEIAVYLKAGGRNDPPGKAGISHFLEHMLFRGTTEYPTTVELETAFEAIGGSANAATDEESTCYFTRLHPAHIPAGLRLFSSMILRPTLDGIETEKKIITEEALEDINERGDEINTHNLASALLWPGHPLGAPTIGYLRTIAGFTTQDLRRHLGEMYVPTNAVVVVAGDVKAEQVFAACSETFGDWRGEQPPVPASPVEAQAAPQAHYVEDSDSQIHLQLAFRGFARSSSRLMPLRLLRRMLCGSGSSRLNLTLRERLGIVYSVDAGISAYEETGSFAVELSTAPENLAVAVSEVLAELSRVVVEPIPEEELERVKRAYLFDLDYSRDSCYEMQVRYGWGELMGLVRSLEEDQAEAAALDCAALQATAAALFAPRNLNLVAVGPVKRAMKREVAKLLAAYEKDWRQP